MPPMGIGRLALNLTTIIGFVLTIYWPEIVSVKSLFVLFVFLLFLFSLPKQSEPLRELSVGQQQQPQDNEIPF